MKIKRDLLKELVLLFVCTGFFFGCGHTPPSNFYRLQPIQGMGKVNQGPLAGKQLALCVGPVILPKYLDRPQIVTMTRTSEVKLASFHRWAEPLQDNFTGVLVENLSQLLGSDRITVFPRESAASSDFQIIVTVIRLDGEAGGTAVLTARWSISGDGGTRELLAKKTDIREPAGAQGYDALVTAESRAVAGLSREIADAVTALEKK